MRSVTKRRVSRVLSGLRVYSTVQGAPAAPDAAPVYYCRREGGPYYCWLYITALEQWRGTRVAKWQLPAGLRTKGSEKLPQLLRSRLREHYNGPEPYYTLGTF